MKSLVGFILISIVKFILFIKRIPNNIRKSRIFTYKIFIPAIILLELLLVQLIVVLVNSKVLFLQFVGLAGIPALMVAIVLLYILSFVYFFYYAVKVKKTYEDGNYSNYVYSVWHFFDKRVTHERVTKSRVAYVYLNNDGLCDDENQTL